MNNHGTGLPGFRSRLDALAEQFGGQQHIRKTVGELFRKALEAQIGRRTGARYGFIDGSIGWMDATDDDFDQAARHVETVICRQRVEVPIAGMATWMGAQLVLRGNAVELERAGMAVTVAMVGDTPDQKHDRYGQPAGEQWHICLTDSGKYLLSGGAYLSGSSPTATHAKSQEAATKALCRMTKTFFSVDIVAVATNAAA